MRNRLKSLFFDLFFVYYFAYGSNMSQERLEKRVGKVKKMGAGYLSDFRLVFDCGKESSYANLKDADDEKVLGVVYRLTKRQLKTLDYYEGVPNHYERSVDFATMLKDEKSLMVEVYINHRNRKEEFPSSVDYLNTLISGCEENNLPSGVFERMKEETTIAAGKLK